jgi:small subunit ribosomal protein S17
MAEEPTVANKGTKRVLTGQVVSDKMDKTIVVAVEKRNVHQLYKKYVSFSKKAKAHDEKNDAKSGDIVRIEECRPLSKNKRWRLLDIVERAK